jgi:NADH-quinone oxidoreductase subunit J
MSTFASVLAQANPDGDDLFVAQNVFFGIIAAVMIVSALRVVTTKNVVHAALYLVIVLAGVAAQFLLLGAEFIGVTQVLVYIGAVVVLFLFGIMLTKARLGDDETVARERRLMASLVALVLFGVMAAVLVGDLEDTHVDIAEPTTTAQVSDTIFSQYLIPFEVVGMLLLAALIGAIVVARKD